MNDISKLELNSKIHLYADDTTLTLAGSSNYLNNAIENDLKVLRQWMSHNRLVINWKKTNSIIFNVSKHNEFDSFVQSNSLMTNDVSIVNSVKILGITIYDFKIIVFKLFVLPVVDYCSTLYSMSCLSKVERCFNKAVRLILGIKFSRCEISDVDYQVKIFKSFGIQPLKLRLFSHYCLFLSNIIKFKRAVSLIGFLNSIRASSAYNLRTKFITPNLRTELKRLSFISISSKLLNLFLYNNIIIKNFDTTFLTLNLLKLYNEFTSIINRVTIDY